MAQRTGLPAIKSRLVLEGGGIETDGEGTGIITESCVLHRNRNPRTSRAECEAELRRLLGLETVIWLPGVKGQDITDGHTDFYARFARPGVVVAHWEPDAHEPDQKVTAEHLRILRAATDARGRRLEVVVLSGPRDVRREYRNCRDFAAGYVNFYVCNGAVIAPEFGDQQVRCPCLGQMAVQGTCVGRQGGCPGGVVARRATCFDHSPPVPVFASPHQTIWSTLSPCLRIWPILCTRFMMMARVVVGSGGSDILCC